MCVFVPASIGEEIKNIYKIKLFRPTIQKGFFFYNRFLFNATDIQLNGIQYIAQTCLNFEPNYLVIKDRAIFFFSRAN